MLDTKNRLFNMIEVCLQCIKYAGYPNALAIGYHYIVTRFFSKLVFTKTYNFLGLKVVFEDNNSVAHMLMELFGMNVYYFKTGSLSPVIIDIGANIGDSLIYFKWLYPKSKIYAFEPLPIAYNMMLKNVELNNFKNVNMFNVGLGNKNERIKFYSDKKGTSRLSSINKLEKESDEIQIKKLSSYKEITRLKKIDLIKIDVEGSEMSILEDIKSILINTKKVIIEYHLLPKVTDNSFDKIISILKEAKLNPTFTGFYRNTKNLGNPIAFLIIASK